MARVWLLYVPPWARVVACSGAWVGKVWVWVWVLRTPVASEQATLTSCQGLPRAIPARPHGGKGLVLQSWVGALAALGRAGVLCMGANGCRPGCRQAINS